MLKKFFEIDNILINGEIAYSKFNCDLSKCKGACCTMESQFGAPVNSEEIKKIEEILPIILDYLPVEHRAVIEKFGFWEIKHDQELLKSVNNRECVFVYYENDIAKCAIEKAYFEGKVDFRKPISCHLFPIRVDEFGGIVLRYEKYPECQPAVEKGKKVGSTVAEFCRDALERAFGKVWYEKFENNIKES